ncbi:MAG: methyltransferase domain-containing protein [Planctomycetes bacterium]|jgi:SAM-dependent methyltransferase|nr:class I SAM-dependent methyltransferase [Phycisphaerae bacterium]NBB94152.1 methyltransferase domain-containing protein [Planctomycetota bacterium]
MSRIYTCCVCKFAQPADEAETADVRSNVRALRQEQFALWRCGQCRSIHARDEVDLDAYYAAYPFFGRELDAITRMGYRRLTRRLRRAGLDPKPLPRRGQWPSGHRGQGQPPPSAREPIRQAQGGLATSPKEGGVEDADTPTERQQTILDYGCGSGLLVEYLRECGYSAVGYDPYSQTHSNPTALQRTYDVIIAQDVIEHDADPLGVLATLDALAAPGGLVAIGTPNADGIDLARPEEFVHPLHQPYHRHILALPALQAAGRDLGWSVERTYLTPYTNMPVISLPFIHHLMRHFDGCIDVLFERPKASLGFWLNPVTWFYMTVGYFLCDNADIVALFRKPTETA